MLEAFASTHLHITAWVLGLILFSVAALSKNEKTSKITKMILRVDYLLIILTGSTLFIHGMDYGMGMLYGFKFLGGILIIGMMEMILARSSKGKSTQTFWILLAVFVFVVMFLGFKLPMGLNFLA